MHLSRRAKARASLCIRRTWGPGEGTRMLQRDHPGVTIPTPSHAPHRRRLAGADATLKNRRPSEEPHLHLHLRQRRPCCRPAHRRRRRAAACRRALGCLGRRSRACEARGEGVLKAWGREALARKAKMKKAAAAAAGLGMHLASS
eukprot:218638-Chlamydomonas_euryale.AAC.2